MAATGQYLGMALSIADLDSDNAAYFRFWCGGVAAAALQSGDLMRYPPGPACPWCAGNAFEWVPVSGRGTVCSYTEVRHAVRPTFRAHVPYLALLVELDEQRAQPTEHEAIRMIGNLATPDAALAPPRWSAPLASGRAYGWCARRSRISRFRCGLWMQRYRRARCRGAIPSSPANHQDRITGSFGRS